MDVSETRIPRYLVAAALGALLALLVVFALVMGTRAAGRADLPYAFLIDYQREKFARPLGDIVFVGDSSLGTAVQADLWQSLTGRSATSLALTGSYGLEGSLATMRAAIAAGARTIVIMQTANMMTRLPQPDVPNFMPGDRGTFERIGEFWRRTMNLDQVNAAYRYLKEDRADSGRVDAAALIEKDYIRQEDRKATPPRDDEFDLSHIITRNGATLEAMADLCRDAGASCVFAYGPLMEPWCREKRDYFAAVNDLVRRSGLTLATEAPPCIPDDELGNTYDHTRVSRKAEMTERIARLLQPHLDGDPSR